MKAPIWIRKLFSPTPRVGDIVSGSIDFSVWFSGVVIERKDYPKFETIYYKVDATVRTSTDWNGVVETREIITVNRNQTHLS